LLRNRRSIGLRLVKLAQNFVTFRRNDDVAMGCALFDYADDSFPIF
jgi:hypothetical protein